MDKRIGIYVNVSPHDGGEYQWWLSILAALGRIKKRGKYDVVLFAKQDDYGKLADELGLEIVNFTGVGKRWQYLVNRIMDFVLPTFVYSKICHVWFPNIKMISDQKIDIWFSKTSKGVKKGLNIPCIAPIFDLMFLYLPEYMELREGAKKRDTLSRNICTTSEIIFVDSEIGKKQVVESYGQYRQNLSEHVKILPYIPADYIFERKEKTGFEKPFDKYIFYPAQFWQHKNHLNLLKAINELRVEDIIVNLVLVGSEKNAGQEIKLYIEENDLKGQVKILGYVNNDEIVSLYTNARAMIYPSLLGPTNIPPLEAMRLGCPCAVSHIFGMSEQVDDAALLFDPHSVSGIKRCIYELWMNDELCTSLKVKGQLRSDSYFGKEMFADKLEKIIDNIKM